jgi:hypothetical protein
MHEVLICVFGVLLIMPGEPPGTWNRYQTCLAITRGATSQGTSPELAAALAFHESRFNAEARSPAGALGPLQVMPRVWCPGGRVDGCDLAKAGLVALKAYQKRWKDPVVAICHYNDGNDCRPGPMAWARGVVATAAHLGRSAHRIETAIKSWLRRYSKQWRRTT